MSDIAIFDSAASVWLLVSDSQMTITSLVSKVCVCVL